MLPPSSCHRRLSGFIRATIYTVISVYYVVVAGLDPLRLVLVGTVLEAAIALFEVPTGVIADVFSRRSRSCSATCCSASRS